MKAELKRLIAYDDGSQLCQLHLPLALSDRITLALAVLEGDDDASLALADEVVMQLRHGDAFVSRQTLIDALRPFAKFVQSRRGNDFVITEPSAPLSSLTEGAVPTLADCIIALEVIERHERMMKT